MIVCNLCGLGVARINDTCPKCSGRGIERPPLKGLLTSRQHQGSPDRWAQNYTSPSNNASPLPPTSAGTPAVKLSPAPSPLSSRHVVPSPNAGDATFDIAVGGSKEGGLARVYGTLLDPKIQHPRCTDCAQDIKPGGKLFLARREQLNICRSGDVLCRNCYTRYFSIGTCQSCQKSVIGEREEGGPHIKGRFGVIWHSKCFVCEGCSVPLAKIDHMLLPHGSPSCITCANHLMKDSSNPPTPEQSKRFLPPSRVVVKPASITAPLISSSSDDPVIKGRFPSAQRDTTDRPLNPAKLVNSPSTTSFGNRPPWSARTSDIAKQAKRLVISDLADTSNVTREGSLARTALSPPLTGSSSTVTVSMKSPGSGASLAEASSARSAVSKLGGMPLCPGCGVKVGPLERGTVTGPSDQRWHQSCLRCGHSVGTGGCGKNLDTNAVVRETGVSCRSCSLASTNVRK